MLDIKFIRENSEEVKENCQRREIKVDIDKLLELDGGRRELLQQIEVLRAERKRSQDMQRLRAIKEELKQPENKLKEVKKEFQKLMLQVPNMALENVGEQKIIRERGKKKQKAIDYLKVAEKLDLIDTQRAAKVSGSRFAYLKRDLVLVQFALIQFAFETLTKEGFIPILPPALISKKAMQGVGFDWQEVYYLEKDNLCLIGTSEHPIAAMHMNEIITGLPKRYLGFSTCFRREAGTWGKDTRGIMRVHQFDKVEMFSFTRPEESEKEHEFLVKMEEKLMQELKIPYRVVQLAINDIAPCSAKTYDVEAWMPGQGKYRETHSCSNCTDFQARRLNIRYEPGKFVHMLNGTALAMGRTLIAIIENYQKKDTSIEVPKVLRKYINVKTIS